MYCYITVINKLYFPLLIGYTLFPKAKSNEQLKKYTSLLEINSL